MSYGKRTAWDIGIVGAGPAGLAAAIFAAGQGKSVLLLDHLVRPGAKLLATGGGRCNITNAAEVSAMCASFGPAARFVRPAVTSFPPSALLSFFSGLGVECEATDGFHYFPTSGSAKEILNALLAACDTAGVDIRPGARVVAFETAGGRVSALRTTENRFPVASAIVASGGKGWPKLGSDGSGYTLAASVGATIVPPLPALGALFCNDAWVRSLSGVSLADAAVTVTPPEGKPVRTRGELLFTHNGLSANAALDASGRIAGLLRSSPTVPVSVDFLPAIPRDQLDATIVAASGVSGSRLVRSELARVLPASLANALSTLAGVYNTQLASLTVTARKALVARVKESPINVTGTDGFEKAMVTTGGVSRDEVSPKTLAFSKLPGLHFAGEVLDVDGPCGGYNLQWAFSSGRLAGLSAGT